MDKKGNRSLPSPKGPASDSKKDVVSKQWPRGGRRREPTAGSLSIKGEPSRKPQPQRDRAFDKRPKPRGTYHATTLGRIEAAGVELDEAELGSVFLPGSKKQSLNHLLNFSYTPYSPRESYQSERSKDKGGHWLATKKHTYNKEHFLQANCQFIVSDSGDYKQYLNNPDALVDWSLVEQVNVQVSEFPSCPICLYPPAAAKMTRCGHIYCWSCVLHYLSLSDKASRKCPICHECVLKQDLKSVVAVPHSTFNVNETITFKLMKRPRGCLTAYPADAEVRDDHAVFNMSDKEAGRVYSKLLLANGGDILSIIARERRELEAQIADEENRPETCFIEQAFVALNGRETSVLEKIQSLIESDSGEDLKTDGGTAGVAELVDHLNISGDVAGQQPKFHFFYQASDGQHIYLNSVNAKMLEHTYGSLEFGPVTITGRILEKEGGSMTEELRIRFKYLQHLPVTCQFEVAEIQLKPPIISRETMEHFKDKIESRRKKRQRRAKEEKRREKRIEAEENRKMGKYPVPNLHLESNIQFPEFGFEARLRTQSECTLPSDRSTSPDLLSSSNVSVETTFSGPSFAAVSMRREQPPSWPSLKPSTSSEPVKTSYVTESKTKASNSGQVRNDSDEEYNSAPSYTNSFNEALEIAFQLAKKKPESEAAATPGKKKKKGKNVIIATNMAFCGKN